MDAIIALIPPKIAAHLPLSNAGYRYVPLDAGLFQLVDVARPSLWLALGTILFNPIYWNIIARNEYRKHTLAQTIGSPHGACYFLAVTIFSLGILRDQFYHQALQEQPHLAILAEPIVKAAAVALFVAGQVFVVSSMWALGVTGTYLGDYCGILMKERVTGFPFNVLNDPMYVGSAMAFLGTALWYESPAGVLLSVIVWIVYSVALKYEGPFTDMIYTTAAAKKADDDKAAAAKTAAAKTAAVEAPQTPRKPRTVATPTATSSSTAAATATATNGSQTPRRRSLRKSVAAGTPAADSPMRVTRSRSRARNSDGDSE